MINILQYMTFLCIFLIQHTCQVPRLPLKGGDFVNPKFATHFHRLKVSSSSVNLSVHSLFLSFLSCPLRYRLEIWTIILFLCNAVQVPLLSCFTYFHMSYCSFLKLSFLDFTLLSFEILTWNLVKTRHVFVKHGMPQAATKSKSLSPKFWPLPPPQGHVM